MMANVLEHRDIESHGLELIVQKQGALLLKEVVTYTLWPKRLKTLPFGAARTYIFHTREYPGHSPLSKVRGHVPSFNCILRQPEKSTSFMANNAGTFRRNGRVSDKARNMYALCMIDLDMVDFWKISWPYFLIFFILFMGRPLDDNGREKSEFQLHIYFLSCINNSLYFLRKSG